MGCIPVRRNGVWSENDLPTITIYRPLIQDENARLWQGPYYEKALRGSRTVAGIYRWELMIMVSF
jgi:hypothetical protein